MTSAYFSPLVSLPVIIDAIGYYETRGGERVEIHIVSQNHDFGCHGCYSDFVAESWHKSGRLYRLRESDNDIVAKL